MTTKITKFICAHFYYSAHVLLRIENKYDLIRLVIFNSLLLHISINKY